ncbi:MAG TPA: hypothetical protein VHU81_14715 [Thermoanaerobaculia bacterium]|nr:hypothetical protein [Thermoanaerobaculia bacterium]
MLRRLAVLAFTVLAVVPGFPAAASPAGEDPCADTALPFALNIGLPQLPDADGFQAAALQTEVGDLIRDFYSHHGRCPERQLQVNITVAGDYEILDWLAQGLIDVAVVPDLTLYLLSRDDIPFRELDLAGHPVGHLLLPPLRPQPSSAQLKGHAWVRRPDPRADFAAFLDDVWGRTRTPPDPGKSPPPPYRLVLASHLSSPGFLAPVDEAGRALEARLGGIQDEKERRALRERFWQELFDHTRFAVDCDSLARIAPEKSRSCWQLPDREEREGSGPVEILFPGEGVLRRLAGPSGDLEGVAPGRFREHLIIAAGVADELFDSGTRDVTVQLPPGAAAFLAADPPLPACASLLEAEAAFGVRTFRFTVDEVFGLLRRHQATSRQHELALVLPGGGVKAAYQSTVVDSLYQEGHLKNFKAEAVPGSIEPLDVRYVIGTSGGALMGYFVSQLGANGPWGLSDILWKKGKDRYVGSTDIFGWTDLLRYVSVIASFLLFCALLAIVSIPDRAPLNPRRAPLRLGTRWRLTLGVLVPVLFFAPLLVSQVSGDALQEHVPEIEGLVYAILAMIAMVTDQAMVRLHNDREGGEPWVSPWLPIALGAALVLIPLLPWGEKSAIGQWLAGSLTFGPAFGTLAPLVLLGGLILPLRKATGIRGWLRPALHFAAATGLALAAAYLLPASWLDAVKARMPFFLAGFLLVLVSVGANFLLASRAGLSAPRRRLVYWGALVASSLLLVVLCWPEKIDAAPFWQHLGKSLATQTLEISVGSFLLVVGLLFLMLGGIARVYAARPSYHLRLTEFLVPYFVVLLHAVAVYLVLLVVIELLPSWLSPLELTREFWLWLLATSLILGSALLVAALRRRGGYLHRSLAFLTSHHPNSELISRRFVRMACWAVFCLTWWNFVVAPALYGNRSAFRYLGTAVTQFRDKAGFTEPYRPTARFVVPANLLKPDGTRYFLFIPADDKCPPIPRRPASGATWHSYRAAFGPPGATPAAAGPARGCQPVSDPQFLHDVIFASGSPFPIFPAHRVTLDGEKQPLVDGGYSNNVPVDVALTVSASQVLIVDSSNPLGHDSSPSLLAGLVPNLKGFHGKLVENLGRLPGFLFERSQQVDRLSRRDLFVVSLAPSREERDWPALFDFRAETVERMETVARRDLGRRIGMVESWGRPRFQLSVPVEGKRERAGPATPEGR